MKLVLGYHTHLLVKRVVEKELEKLGIDFSYTDTGQIELLKEIDNEVYYNIKLNLLEYGIYVKFNNQQQDVLKIDEVLSKKENYNCDLLNKPELGTKRKKYGNVF